MRNRQLLLIMAALMAAAPALAQTASRPTVGGGQAGAETIITQEKPSQIRAEKLLGMKVVNRMGEEVGTVDDIVIDPSGKVSGLVVKTGGFMGIGGKAVAIAWQDVSNAARSDVVNIALTKADLEKAPAFKTKDGQSNGSAEHQSNGNAEPQNPGTPLPLEPMNSRSR